MAEHTEQTEPRADGDATVEDGAVTRRATTWEVVPAAREGTVPVRWADLRAMRSRIDDLETEVTRLETELDRSRRRRRRTVDRYERLLDAGDAWGSSVPRVPESETESADAAGAGETAADGEARERGAADGRRGETTSGGPLGRVLAAVGAVLGVR
jgi:hypothetical protein